MVKLFAILALVPVFLERCSRNGEGMAVQMVVEKAARAIEAM
jgi:hypothetical protein